MANPALASFNNDSPAGQALERGTQDVTIPSTSGNVNYVAEVVDHSYFDSEWQETRNALGVLNKQAAHEKLPEIQIQLQPTGNAGLPNKFAYFQLLGADGITYWWIVSSIKRVTKNDGTPTAITIGARYRLNGP